MLSCKQVHKFVRIVYMQRIPSSIRNYPHVIYLGQLLTSKAKSCIYITQKHKATQILNWDFTQGIFGRGEDEFQVQQCGNPKFGVPALCTQLANTAVELSQARQSKGGKSRFSLFPLPRKTLLIQLSNQVGHQVLHEHIPLSYQGSSVG